MVQFQQSGLVTPMKCRTDARATNLSPLSGGGALPIRAASAQIFEAEFSNMPRGHLTRPRARGVPQTGCLNSDGFDATAGTCGLLAVRAKHPGGAHCQTNQRLGQSRARPITKSS